MSSGPGAAVATARVDAVAGPTWYVRVGDVAGPGAAAALLLLLLSARSRRPRPSPGPRPVSVSPETGH